MKGAPSLPMRPTSQRGVALVTVLLFVVLIVGLVLIFLSRSRSAFQVSTSTLNATSAQIIGQSATDIIVGDLKQEIIAGSIPYGTTTFPVYAPGHVSGATTTLTPLTMKPFRNGVPLTGVDIPNLISRSVRPSNTGGPAPYIPYPASLYSQSGQSGVPPNRAADDSNETKVSTTTPSLNGRYISLSQWNSHYLIPRDPSTDPLGSTSTDSTPINTFVAPDWVVVTRQGANSVKWSTTLSNSSPANQNYAVGRYAFAVYNEGGLLDMNAAGYPADPTAPTGSNGLSIKQASQKGSLALADLTQLAVGTTKLAQSQVNSIVGWRNYATAGLSGNTFPTFTFSSVTATKWLNNFGQNNTNAFLNVVTPAGSTPTQTDQAFLSRQELISLIQSLNISSDFLQYLGTFSRGLEQPSYLPDPSRPRIIHAGSVPPNAQVVDTYLGNNDAEGGDDLINPFFLNVTVQSKFQRLNGTQAVVGEPLVKTKFALSRLALVTYNATATQVAGDPIYDRFGLYRNNASQPWTYNHGGNGAILTLEKVAALNPGREPDFAELLKASISAGAMGKAGPTLHDNQGNYQYTLDVGADLQVLQVMANLIDQQDTDSYPTVIQLPYGSLFKTIYGVEDLPYFYRYHQMSVVTRLPSPLVSNSSTPIVFAGEPPTGSPLPQFTTTGSTSRGYPFPAFSSSTPTQPVSWSATPPDTASRTLSSAVPGTLNDPGQAALLYLVDVWNPHDMNSLSLTTGPRPASFRVYATTSDPAQPPQTPAWYIGAQTSLNAPPSLIPNTTNGGSIYVTPASVNLAQLTLSTSALTFFDNSGKLFREPTLLWNENPTNITLAAPNGSNGAVTEFNTQKIYFGVVAGFSPVSQQVTFASTPAQPTDGTYVVQGTGVSVLPDNPPNSYQNITFWLQYQDPNNSSNYITYDVKYPDLHGLYAPGLVVNTSDYSNDSWKNPLQNGQFSDHASSRDPRTARWGVGTESSLGEISPGTQGSSTANETWLLEATANVNGPNSSNFNTTAGNDAISKSNFSVLETNRARGDKGDQVNYSNPGMTSDPGQNLNMRIFSGVGWSATGAGSNPLEFDGLLSQNNPAILFNSKDNSGSGQSNYFEDADGVARRAMGAYAPTSLTDSNTSSLGNPGNTSRIGLPMATAELVNNVAMYSATSQTQSRPIILNRPFRSVSEMSYAFTGTPWKNIDFFTPESGYSALLDTFCVMEPPANAMVAGKVDLNTRQEPVLQALIAGAYRDEMYNITTTTPPAYALPPLTSAEASNIANKLVSITTDTTDVWRGPLVNMASLVGHYVNTTGAITATDTYNYAPPSPVSGQPSNITYAGLSAALDNTIYTNTTSSAALSTPYIQRFRESGLRPLVDGGQVRVWNLLVDVVAQSGHYPPSASGLDQFSVNGQAHYWVHLALDRYTGQIIDKQVEVAP